MKQESNYRWAFDSERFAASVKTAAALSGMLYGEIDEMHGWPNGYTSHVINLKQGERVSVVRFEMLCNIFDLDPRDYWMVMK